MSNFSLPSPPSPNLSSDFEMAMYLEAQRAGFSSSPPPASTPSNAIMQNRNDSGAYPLQSSPGSQENTNQRKDDESKGKEPCRQEGTSSSTPAPQGPLSSQEVPSQYGVDQGHTEAEGSHQATSSSRLSNERAATAVPGHAEATSSTILNRRSPSRTFTAPTVSWSTFRALSPFSFEENSDEDSQESSSSDEEFSRRFPTLSPPTQPASPPPAVATAQHIHLRSISGSSQVSEIEVARDINRLPPLVRCPPRPLSLRPLHPSSHRPRDRSPPRIRSVVSFSDQRFDKTNPSPWYHDLVALNAPNPDDPTSNSPQGLQGSPNNSSSTSLGSRAHTPGGSRFVEHVHANGEAMYMSRRMGVVGSRSDVALGRYENPEVVERRGGVWEGVARGVARGVERSREEEEKKKGEGEGKRGWKGILCFA